VVACSFGKTIDTGDSLNYKGTAHINIYHLQRKQTQTCLDKEHEIQILKKPEDHSTGYIYYRVRGPFFFFLKLYIDTPYYCYHTLFASKRCYDRLTPLEEMKWV